MSGSGVIRSEGPIRTFRQMANICAPATPEIVFFVLLFCNCRCATLPKWAHSSQQSSNPALPSPCRRFEQALRSGYRVMLRLDWLGACVGGGAGGLGWGADGWGMQALLLGGCYGINLLVGVPDGSGRAGVRQKRPPLDAHPPPPVHVGSTHTDTHKTLRIQSH